MTQDNKPVHFFDDLLKGKTVMINFAFTTCAGVCSPMSVDPVIDTPEVLRQAISASKQCGL